MKANCHVSRTYHTEEQIRAMRQTKPPRQLSAKAAATWYRKYEQHKII